MAGMLFARAVATLGASAASLQLAYELYHRGLSAGGSLRVALFLAIVVIGTRALQQLSTVPARTRN